VDLYHIALRVYRRQRDQTIQNVVAGAGPMVSSHSTPVVNSNELENEANEAATISNTNGSDGVSNPAPNEVAKQRDNVADLRIAHTLVGLGQQSANLGSSLKGFNTEGTRNALVQALESLREAMELFRQVYRDNFHPLVMTCLRSLAAVHSEQGKHRTARAVYDKILELYREAQAGDSTEFADTLSSMAAELRTGDQEDLLEAQILLQQALDLYRRLLGTDHIEVANTLFRLAMTHFELDEFKEAEPLFIEALGMFRDIEAVDESAEKSRKVSIRGHTDRFLDRRGIGVTFKSNAANSVAAITIPDILNCLGSINHHELDYEIAKSMYTDSLRKYINLYGEIHPHVAKTLNNLATLMDDRGETQEAYELYEHALHVLQQFYGRCHSQVVLAMENLANMLLTRGDAASLEEANSLLEAAQEIQTELEGNEYVDIHPDDEEEVKEKDTGLIDYLHTSPFTDGNPSLPAKVKDTPCIQM
jgi:tetratricopeptide (TPR) repeat protein